MSNSKLLINQTLNVKGAILNAQDMINISRHYKRTAVQEYVYEQYENTENPVSEEDALKIADKAIDIMEDSGYTENDSINIAAEKLGFNKAFFG